MRHATVNKYGDLVCPHVCCPTRIITPLGCDVMEGTGACPFCKEEFRVTEETARLANERANTKAEGQKEGEL